jgi:hypothetical protein
LLAIFRPLWSRLFVLFFGELVIGFDVCLKGETLVFAILLIFDDYVSESYTEDFFVTGFLLKVLFLVKYDIKGLVLLFLLFLELLLL